MTARQDAVSVGGETVGKRADRPGEGEHRDEHRGRGPPTASTVGCPVRRQPSSIPIPVVVLSP